MHRQDQIKVGSILKPKLETEYKKCLSYQVIETLPNGSYKCKCQTDQSKVKTFTFEEIIIIRQ